MFKPEKMFKVKVVIPRAKRETVLSSLQQKKICQIESAKATLEVIPLVEDERKVLNLYSRLVFVKDHLEQYKEATPVNVVKDLFTRKSPVKVQRNCLSKQHLFTKIEECLEIIEESVRNNVKEIERLKELKNKNDYIIDNLEHIPDIPTSQLQDTENLKVLIGFINAIDSGKISELQKKSIILLNPVDKKRNLLIMICLHKDSAHIETALHQIGFDAITIAYEDKSPLEIIRKLKNDSTDLIRQKNEIVKEQEKLYQNYYPLLTYFREQLLILKERIDAASLLKSSESFSVLECWVPKKEIDGFRNELAACCPGHYLSWEEEDDAPTLLNNPKLIKPFEKILELHSLPKYRDLDPTPMLAITFSLFFGFIMTDFFYGIILLSLGTVLILGKGSYNSSTKNMGIIISIFGLITLVMGIIFGSYFGDFFQKMGFKIPMLIDSMGQAMIVLIIALTIGILHLIIGLVLGFIQNARKGKMFDALQSQGVWLAFAAALICFVFKLNIIGLILLGLAVIGQVGFTFYTSGLVPSVLSVFGFAGFTGDLFSYGRLMALMVSSSGISLAFNFMILMSWTIPFIGPVVAILLFLLGHTFNLLMGCLGGFVHTTRLHFLECFSKFYEGGGKKYSPFGTKND